MTALTLCGVPVVSSTFAVRRRLTVRRHPIRKHRREWNLVWVEEPTVFVLDGNPFGGALPYIVCHPILLAKLRRVI